MRKERTKKGREGTWIQNGLRAILLKQGPFSVTRPLWLEEWPLREKGNVAMWNKRNKGWCGDNFAAV